MNKKGYENVNTDMFRSYDIRTVAKLLTLDLSERVAYALAKYFREILKTNKVVLSRDARLSAPKYLEQGVKIFKELGFEVIVNTKVSSTCQFYYSCMQHMDAAGVMYSASHNPGKDIGQKIVGPGVRPIATGCGPEGGLTKIKEFYLEDKRIELAGVGSLRLIDFEESFVKYSMELAGVKENDLKGLNVLMDFLSGSAGSETLKAFGIAGANVTSRNIIPDGNFPSGDPDPTVLSSIKGTLAELKKGDYAFAIAFDGDGDRLELLTSEGETFGPSFNLSIIAPEILELYKDRTDKNVVPKFYSCIKGNPYGIMDIAGNGVEAHMIKNGHSHIKEALLKNWKSKYLCAVEETCHYFMNFPVDIEDLKSSIVPTENTLYFALLTAKMWLKYPEKYKACLELQNKTYIQREFAIEFESDEQIFKALKEVEEFFVGEGFNAIKKMEDGTDIGGTLMRQGLPVLINEETEKTSEWTQVAQHKSQNEAGFARWSVTAGTEERREFAYKHLLHIAKKCAIDSNK